jgi:hypothetical protein
MRKKTLQLLLVLFSMCFTLSHPTRLYAATVEVLNVKLIPYPLSANDNGADFVVSYDPSLAAPCGSGVLYVAPEDKALLAIATAAQVAGLRVHIRYDNNAPEAFMTTFPQSGQGIGCKLVGVWINQSSY